MENNVEDREEELTDTMDRQHDLESRLTDPSLSGSTSKVSEISMEGLGEKVGEAEVEEDIFRNIWHEYLFIFVVTSAQLITVSSDVAVIRHIRLTRCVMQYSKPIWETQLFP